MLGEDLDPSLEAHSRRWELVVNAYFQGMRQRNVRGARDPLLLDSGAPEPAGDFSFSPLTERGEARRGRGAQPA